jgi:hypothetical protein
MAASEQIDAFVAQYTPEIATQLRRARVELRKLIPKGYELVYDSHNALIFAFGPTARASELVVSIAGYPNWVTLFFSRGNGLEDPQGLLEGTGGTIRSMRLTPFSLLRSRPVRALIRQALAAQADSFKHAPALTTVLKSISPKRRPRAPSGPKSGPPPNNRWKGRDA